MILKVLYYDELFVMYALFYHKLNMLTTYLVFHIV